MTPGHPETEPNMDPPRSSPAGAGQAPAPARPSIRPAPVRPALVQPPSFDPVWESDLYGQGRMLNRYPYDIVVSFVLRHFPRDCPREEVRVLEIGCGAGNNLVFAAQEGFDVAGIDGSVSAIAFARQRFADLSLRGDLRVGDFTELPFDNGTFDLAFDRGALVCTGLSPGRRAVGEVHRVLKLGGKFLFNPYSQEHTSARSGHAIGDGLVTDVRRGTVAGAGQLCFYSRSDLDACLQAGWQTLSLEHMKAKQLIDTPPTVHAEWRVVLQKVSA